MAKHLSELYTPRSKGERDFVAQNKVTKSDYPEGSEVAFTGGKVKVIKRREKRMGADAGEDTSGEVCESTRSKRELDEDWKVVDRKNKTVLSHHGSNEKSAKQAARKMDFANFHKTGEKARYGYMNHKPKPQKEEKKEPAKNKKPTKKKSSAKKVNKKDGRSINPIARRIGHAIAAALFN